MEGLNTAAGKVKTVKGMLKAAGTFYKELFSDRERRETTVDIFLNDLDKRLEGKVTFEEVEVAVRSLKGGTSPGGDGLPSEFYQAFLPLVGPD